LLLIIPWKIALSTFHLKKLQQIMNASQMHRESAIISAPAGMTWANTIGIVTWILPTSTGRTNNIGFQIIIPKGDHHESDYKLSISAGGGFRLDDAGLFAGALRG
jgi:hypothetical protein